MSLPAKIYHYNFDILDKINGQGANNQSQTNYARLCEFKSNNVIAISASMFGRL
jgi:hypothetical protein